jgi:hypothetical protein
VNTSLYNFTSLYFTKYDFLVLQKEGLKVEIRDIYYLRCFCLILRSEGVLFSIFNKGLLIEKNSIPTELRSIPDKILFYIFMALYPENYDVS